TFEFTGAARLHRAASGGMIGWASRSSNEQLRRMPILRAKNTPLRTPREKLIVQANHGLAITGRWRADRTPRRYLIEKIAIINVSGSQLPGIRT
ncbi:MAG: hypothetical protein K8H75_15100, partial [Sulfuricella sp.]|nr:hypothetical protein [Sulfuricella sp.]